MMDGGLKRERQCVRISSVMLWSHLVGFCMRHMKVENSKLKKNQNFWSETKCRYVCCFAVGRQMEGINLI